MTRMIRDVTRNATVEPVAFPVPTPAYLESDLEPIRYEMGLRTNREFAPYQPGELLLANIGTLEAPRLRLARVYVVIPDKMEMAGHYIPRYRSQLCTKVGTWSLQWRDLWPGDVFRAFRTGPDQPRELPEAITLEWVRAQP
jgi:hypothetical protein